MNQLQNQLVWEHFVSEMDKLIYSNACKMICFFFFSSLKQVNVPYESFVKLSFYFAKKKTDIRTHYYSLAVCITSQWSTHQKNSKSINEYIVFYLGMAEIRQF